MCDTYTHCDYCSSNRGFISSLIGGKVIYACASCINSMDDYIRSIDESLLNTWSYLNTKVRYFSCNLTSDEFDKLTFNIETVRDRITDIQIEWMETHKL